MVNYNHTQVEELQMSEREIWERKLRINRNNPVGIETSLGHAYSIILEELAEQGLDSSPNLEGFLNHIKDHLRENGEGYEATQIKVTTPSFYPNYTNSMITFMGKKGLNSLSCEKIMKDIVGPNFNRYSKEMIEKIFF